MKRYKGHPVFFIDDNRKKRNTAGAKAPDDIAQICEDLGFGRIAIPQFPTGTNWIYQKIWLLLICQYHWNRIRRKIRPGSIIIFQHPSYGKRVANRIIPKIKKEKDCKFIAVIHDLESLRGGIQGVIREKQKTSQIGDHDLLKHFDAIICHNEHMRQYLIGEGFAPEKLVNLEIFDYLSDIRRVQPDKGECPSIAIAGNLAMGKCKYIYDICTDGHNTNLDIHLYGNNYEDDKAVSNMIYHGSFKPEELPGHLVGDFGLVWDGMSAETCAGNTGEYLKYNNPHKTSLYLSSGMPVIVWKQAAIADFVRENKVGIIIDNLEDLQGSITCISAKEYQFMCNNVQRIAQNLHDGYYFKKALRIAMLKIIN